MTFLFTDIAGSTRLWEDHGDAMAATLNRHDEVMREAVEAFDGYLVKSTGDGALAAFSDVRDALRAAVSAQQTFADPGWDGKLALKVRTAIHTGTATERDGDYFGPVLNRAARLLAIGHGGQLLLSNSAASLARDVLDDGYRLIDLGEHRLRDLSRTERIFQLVVPDLGHDFPPLRSLDRVPTNLSEQLTSFVGRDRELREIGALLRAHRLVTITGVGGVGKTRLALQLAAEVSTWNTDGVWVCELASAETDQMMVEVMGAVLGVPARGSLSRCESIVEFLRTKKVLLVVDNCEHLLDAVATVVTAILRECPSVTVLATSREGLGVEGERLWPLRSLSLAPVGASDDEVAASDAVSLFVDRALGADPGFARGSAPGSTTAVAEICRRLDGIPLAIELAAARTAALSTSEIATLLDERFRLLTRGRRGAVDRHQTLRATVDWSYSLLSESERLLFDRLGVFPGSFDARAAGMVAAGDGVDAFAVIDLLTELVAKSMLVADRSADDTIRYVLLETLRDYALEHLALRGETDDLRRRHAAHYAAVAEHMGPGLLSPDEVVWRDRVGLELDNLRAAVDWSLESEGDEELAFRIIAALAYEVTDFRAAGIGAWAERAAHTSALDASPCRSWVLGVAAYGAFHRGDLTAAEAYARALDVEPTPAWVHAQGALGNVAASRGDLASALEIYGAARAAVGAGDEWRYPSCWVPAVRAIYAGIAGDRELARAETEAGLEAARGFGQPSALALALYVCAMTRMDDEPDRALRDAEESVALHRAGASDVVYANATLVTSVLRERAGDIAGAAAAAREAVAHADAIGDRSGTYGLSSALRLLFTGGDIEGAVVLAGAVIDGWFRELVLTTSDELTQRDAILRSAAQTLGPDRYAAARARGAAMAYEAVIRYVLEALDRAFPPSHPE